MAEKKGVGSSDDKKKGAKKTAKKTRRKSTSTVDHALASRWIQEQILTELPELGYLSESLIERITKKFLQYYIQQGFSSIKLADK